MHVLILSKLAYMSTFAIDNYSKISNEPGYLGRGREFMADTSWLACDYMTRDVLFDSQLSQRLACTIVGTVVSEDLKMEPHGNFDPAIGNLEKAMLKIKLVPPSTEYPEYQQDFLTGINCLQDLVISLCDCTPISHVVVVDEVRDPVAMIISHPIFKAKVSATLAYYNTFY